MLEHIFWKAEITTASCENILLENSDKNPFKMAWFFEQEINFKGLLKSNLLHVKMFTLNMWK